MSNILNLIRPDLQSFVPYRSARDETVNGTIWLNANESPYDVEIGGTKINRYPEKQPNALIQRISEIVGVLESQILISRGSDELIDLLIRLFCVPYKDMIMTCTPTYRMYSVSAHLQGAKVIEVPLLKKDFQLDLAGIRSMKKNKKIKIIFLCSPNNPTGNLFKIEDIICLCKEFSNQSIIVVDEAYIEYANAMSSSRLIKDYNNLVVLRTFSKAFGLAAARCGFLLSNEIMIHWLLKIIAPYPLSPLVTSLIMKSLSDDRLVEVKHQVDCIKQERAQLMMALSQLAFVKEIWPSETNFLLCHFDNVSPILKRCMDKGVILRLFNNIGLDNCLRISIGLPQENATLINVLRGV